MRLTSPWSWCRPSPGKPRPARLSRAIALLTLALLARPVCAQTVRPGDVAVLLDRYLTTYDDRLQRLLSDGAIRRAMRIAGQNARFNLGQHLVSRNINVPTFALAMMHPRVRDRFKVRRVSAGVLGDRRGWLMEFRERERPTLVRTPEGRDRAMRIEALVDMQMAERYEAPTGEVVSGEATYANFQRFETSGRIVR